MIATSFARKARPLEIAPVRASGSPSASRPQPSSKYDASLSGAAPWALSALPECFEQVSETHGTLAFVDARLPPGGTLAPPGSVLRAADCGVTIRTRDALVRRGDLALAIPPDARFYVWSDRFALVRREGGRADLRLYRAAPGASVVFEPGERNGR